MAELADGRGFARTVDADHQDYVGAGKTEHFQRLGDGREDRFDFLGKDGAKAALIELFEPARGNRLADAAASGPRSEAIRASSMSSSVEYRARRGWSGREIAGDLVGGLGKPAGRRSSQLTPKPPSVDAVAAGDADRPTFAALAPGRAWGEISRCDRSRRLRPQRGLGGARSSGRARRRARAAAASRRRARLSQCHAALR
jgi:hypothetical protein